MSNSGLPKWIINLDEDELNFIKKFLLSSGSLKEIAAFYNVTYPTVRLRLDRLIEKVKINDESKDDSYISLIKNLALNDKIDYYTAKTLITEYRKISQNKDNSEE